MKFETIFKNYLKNTEIQHFYEKVNTCNHEEEEEIKNNLQQLKIKIDFLSLKHCIDFKDQLHCIEFKIKIDSIINQIHGLNMILKIVESI